MTSITGENNADEGPQYEGSDSADVTTQKQHFGRSKDQNTLSKRWEETQNTARTRVQSLRMAWSQRRSELEKQAEEARELYDQATTKASPCQGQEKKSDHDKTLIVMTSINNGGDMLWNQTTVYPAMRYHISHLPFSRGRKRLVANVRASPWSESSITSRHRPTSQNTDASFTNRHTTAGSSSWLSFPAPSSEVSPLPSSPFTSRALLQSGTGDLLPAPSSARGGDTARVHRFDAPNNEQKKLQASERKKTFIMSEGTETLLMHGKVEHGNGMASENVHAGHHKQSTQNQSMQVEEVSHRNPTIKVTVQTKPPSPVKNTSGPRLFNLSHELPLHESHTHLMDSEDDEDERIVIETPLAQFLESHNAIFNVRQRQFTVPEDLSMTNSLPAIKRGATDEVHITSTIHLDTLRQSTKTGINPAKIIPSTFPMHTPSHTPYSPRQILTMAAQSKASKRDADVLIPLANRGWQTDRGTHRSAHTCHIKQHANAGSFTERGTSRSAYLSSARFGTSGDMGEGTYKYEHVGRVEFEDVHVRSAQKKFDMASWCKAADVVPISPHRQVLGCRNLTSDDYEVRVVCMRVFCAHVYYDNMM
jgi:hypothetical protein